jgi:dienelactone hydrolase
VKGVLCPRAAVAATLLALPIGASAQSFDHIKALRQLPRLEFPARPVEEAPASLPDMAVYKPAGPGPFAAVVVHHNCAGVRAHIGYWTDALVKAGYAALVLDSLGQRNVRNNCNPPLPVNTVEGTLDAYHALEHLAAQPYVDRSRIGMLGFSWGGMTALLAARQSIHAKLPRERKDVQFRAIASVYPICRVPAGALAHIKLDVEYLGADSDRTLLVLMGGKDAEAPSNDCLPALEALKAKGAKVQWEVYPEATHAWDSRDQNGYSKRTLFGTTETYAYSAETTEASRKRVLEFFGRELK